MAFFVTSVFVYFLHLSVASANDRIHFGQKVVIQSANGSTVDGLLRYNLESDISTCIYECKIRPRCRFINYHRLLLQCDLLRSEIATETVVFTKSPGYVYGNKDDWSLNTPCHGCGMFETCEATSASFQCSIKECGIPPVFPSSVVIGNMHTVGSRNAYECTQYKAMTIYTTHISECLPNGTWSDPDFVCLDTDECIGNPCQHDGTCVDGINEYTCTCASGWQGTNCENDINECGSNPCQNAGTCINEENQYSCTCANGWSGSNCEINTDECIGNPCQHDGTCMDGINEYTCTCASGWQETNCENDINECGSNPCQNAGTCIDGENQYTCTCANGWSGNNCEINIDECDSNPCQNGGTCTDKTNGYSCSCTNNWTGGNCQTGQCMSGWSSYMTSCYKLNAFKKKNTEAKNECSIYGAHLADVSSMAEMDFLKGIYLASHNPQDIDGIWLSTNDIAEEDIWRLSDNTIATFMNWAYGQPDKQYSYDDCLQVWPETQFQWNDVDCAFRYWFYCEYEL